MFRIESLLSARLFVSPQVVGKRVYFISNLSGHLSLYVTEAVFLNLCSLRILSCITLI